MCKLLFGLAITAGFATSCFFAISPAAAEPYKWCALYGYDGGKNCGFVTIEQCRATISGVGGSCVENQFYTGPETRPAQGTRKQRLG